MAAPSIREKISFEPNLAQTITLQYASGKETAGRNGQPDYLYWLEGNRSMFAPPELHAAIQAHHPQQGDTFEVCKIVRGRTARWEVVQICDEQPEDQTAGPQPAPPPVAPTPTNSQARPPVQRTTAQPPFDPRPNGPLPADFHSQARAAEHAKPAASAAPVTPLTRASLDLVSCFVAAIDAATEAQTYAAKRGFTLRLDSADIRALAISLNIDRSRGGAR